MAGQCEGAMWAATAYRRAGVGRFPRAAPAATLSQVLQPRRDPAPPPARTSTPSPLVAPALPTAVAPYPRPSSVVFPPRGSLAQSVSALPTPTVTPTPTPAVAVAMSGLGFLGGGMMAEAILRGLLAKSIVKPADVYVSEPYPPRQEVMRGLGVHVVDGADVIRSASTVFVAVKPDVVPSLLASLSPALVDSPSTLLVSIAAGVTLATLRGAVPPSARVARVMPNTPCLVGATAAAFSLEAGSPSADDDATLVTTLFSAVGLAVQVPETQLDAVTGLSGSGPAYVYTFIEALADGGVLNGLPRATARRLAAQLVYGSAKMVVEAEDVHPAELRNRVESPGGTTIAGSAALEAGGLRSAVIGAVSAATRRAKEMAAPPPPPREE